jgi:hypothetical protein
VKFAVQFRPVPMHRGSEPLSNYRSGKTMRLEDGTPLNYVDNDNPAEIQSAIQIS